MLGVTIMHKQNFDSFYEQVSLSMETSILYSWKQDIYKFFKDGFFRSCHFGRLTKNPPFGLSDQQRVLKQQEANPCSTLHDQDDIQHQSQ